MNNLTNEQIAAIREAQVKAASAGFAQSLINHGFTADMAKDATTLYAANGGLLHKRASRIAAVREGVLQKVAAMRSGR
jgi:predicted transcriptional regulator